MAAERTASGGNRAAITICVVLATLMQALDTTIANVALPYMQGSVAASQDQIDWVLTSYIVAAAIMTPPTGFLAARFGLKRLFLVSVAGFTVASMLCGMAQSLSQIVIFRILQAAAHTTTNNMQHRSLAFSISAIVLMIMWAVFAVRILLGLP